MRGGRLTCYWREGGEERLGKGLDYLLTCRCLPACLPACSYAFGLCLWAFYAERTHAWADAAGKVAGRGALTLKVSRGERPDLAALRPDTPPAVCALIERCWAQAASDRPTARAIAYEIAGPVVRWTMGAGGGVALLEVLLLLLA